MDTGKPALLASSGHLSLSPLLYQDQATQQRMEHQTFEETEIKSTTFKDTVIVFQTQQKQQQQLIRFCELKDVFANRTLFTYL